MKSINYCHQCAVTKEPCGKCDKYWKDGEYSLSIPQLCSSFSLNMLKEESDEYNINVRKIRTHEAVDIMREGFTSAIGHYATASIVSELTGITVNPNRVTARLEKGESMLVAQYHGPRLYEGAYKLPPGGTIIFYVVTAV